MQVGSMTFGKVIVLDFEFSARPGDLPDPICLVARSLVTGTTHRLWRDELLRRPEPPYPLVVREAGRIRAVCCFVQQYTRASV